MTEMDYARILETRECPGCANNRPGTKGDCQIKLHVVFGAPVLDTMAEWMHKQIFTGACKQRRPR